MTDTDTLSVADFVPGGILATDHKHLLIYDETCSRCRKAIAEYEVPLLLWVDDAVNMYSFCIRCMNPPPDGAQVCRECGCWDLAACLDEFGEPCHWVEPDLCSQCAVTLSGESNVVELPKQPSRR